MNLLPLYCNKCGIDFLQNEGGICEICGKAFCLSHLLQSEDKQHLCCQEHAGEKFVPVKSLPFTGHSLQARELLHKTNRGKH